MEVRDFIGEKCKFDEEGGGYIWGMHGEGMQMIAEIRGWGAIQNLFKDSKGFVDMEKAEKFQDDMGLWLAEAINEKLERERK